MSDSTCRPHSPTDLRHEPWPPGRRGPRGERPAERGGGDPPSAAARPGLERRPVPGACAAAAGRERLSSAASRVALAALRVRSPASDGARAPSTAALSRLTDPDAAPEIRGVDVINSTLARVTWSAVPKDSVRGRLRGYQVCASPPHHPAPPDPVSEDAPSARRAAGTLMVLVFTADKLVENEKPAGREDAPQASERAALCGAEKLRDAADPRGLQRVPPDGLRLQLQGRRPRERAPRLPDTRRRWAWGGWGVRRADASVSARRRERGLPGLAARCP